MEQPPTGEHPRDDPTATPSTGEVDPPEASPDVASKEVGADKGSGGRFLKELPILILIAFGLALLIKTFLAQAFFIPSESMVPTLEVDDRVLVNKLVYRFRDPRRGEIVVFVAESDRRERAFWQRVRSFLTEGLGVVRPEEKDFIKRVIGLPGETIEIDREGRVRITPADGGAAFLLEEPYLADERDETPFGPTTVPEDSYFVMGDNRPNSSDSRKLLGPIHRSDIIGKAFIRIWPPGRFGFFRTPSYEEARAALPSGVSWHAAAVAVSFAAWSRTADWKRSSAGQDSRWSPVSTKRAVARSPGRW